MAAFALAQDKKLGFFDRFATRSTRLFANPSPELATRGSAVPKAQLTTPDVPVSGSSAPMNVSGALAGLKDNLAPMPTVPKKRGVFDRVGDFVGSDEGRAALFRAGATMLDGGSVGDGLMAGANMVDQRRAERIKQAENDRQFGLDQGRLGVAQKNADTERDRVITSASRDATANKIAATRVKLQAQQAAARLGFDYDRLAHDQKMGFQQFVIAQMRDQTDRRGQDVSRANSQDSTAASYYGADSARHTADENRAASNGKKMEVETTVGDSTATASRVAPHYGEVRYDEKGNAYRLDKFTGKPVRIR